MLGAALALSAGAILGAMLRWLLSSGLNSILPQLAVGTLSANLLGAYLVGLAYGFCSQNLQLSPEWRLFLFTGLLGSLTTFSAFSLEVVGMLRDQRLLWAFATIALHLLGSLSLTALGLLSFFWLQK